MDLRFEMAGEDVCNGLDGKLVCKEGLDGPEMLRNTPRSIQANDNRGTNDPKGKGPLNP